MKFDVIIGNPPYQMNDGGGTGSSAMPIQDFSESWTDAKLYAKYGLTDTEIAFIESMIRPMEIGGICEEGGG